MSSKCRQPMWLRYPLPRKLQSRPRMCLRQPQPVTPSAPVTEAVVAELKEQHFTILYGDTGHSYESILGPYLRGAKAVVIEDPYIRLQHQIQNFVRFCETILKTASVKKISLITGYDDNTQLADIAEKLEELKQSLLELDVELEVKLNPNMHDREIRLDNGWVIKIGRGLDFYQKPGGWFEVGANDLSLRKCLETKVDIFAPEWAVRDGTRLPLGLGKNHPRPNDDGGPQGEKLSVHVLQRMECGLRYRSAGCNGVVH
jgi:hypothetical protein